MTDDDRFEVPANRTTGDYLHALARTGLSAIPVAGGPATELFSVVIAPPLAKRRDKWMTEIGEGLRRLEEEQELNLAALSGNDEFIDIVMSASAAAIRTANSSKRGALRNAVLNTAVGRSPEESLAQVFVSLVDQFTDWHLKILTLFQNPEVHNSTYNVSSGSPVGLIHHVYPHLGDQRKLYTQVWRDLYQRGLVKSDSDILFTSMTGTPSGVFAKRTTELGDNFLAFIRA